MILEKYNKNPRCILFRNVEINLRKNKTEIVGFGYTKEGSGTPGAKQKLTASPLFGSACLFVCVLWVFCFFFSLTVFFSILGFTAIEPLSIEPDPVFCPKP